MEVADVVYTVLHHRKSFDAAAECETGVNVRVDAAVLEYLRMDHAASEIFDPACLFAYAASLSFADLAFEIKLESRFYEREE